MPTASMTVVSESVGNLGALLTLDLKNCKKLTALCRGRAASAGFF
jgi:hypothetical protein